MVKCMSTINNLYMAEKSTLSENVVKFSAIMGILAAFTGSAWAFAQVGEGIARIAYNSTPNPGDLEDWLHGGEIIGGLGGLALFYIALFNIMGRKK